MINTRTSATVLAVALGVLGVGACSADWNDWEYIAPSGTITYLEYEGAEHGEECGYNYEYDPISGRYKNVYGCDTYYEAECWLVEYESPSGDVYEDCTTESMWNQLETGMFYTENQTELTSPSPSTATT